MVSLLGNAGTFWLYGLVAIGAWVFFYRLVPETKEKGLEQIRRPGARENHRANFEIGGQRSQ